MMTSPLFVLYLVSILFETLALLGQQSSLLRYVETQFRAPIYKANYFSGKNLQNINIVENLALDIPKISSYACFWGRHTATKLSL